MTLETLPIIAIGVPILALILADLLTIITRWK